MRKLTDTQTMLLAHASQSNDGSFYPLPAALDGTDRAPKAIDALIKASLAEERETNNRTVTFRIDGDLRFGVFVTNAGLAAIGITDADVASIPDIQINYFDKTRSAAADPTESARITKASAVLALLQRDGGATIAELMQATGWLPHTTRAALTGLRKKGHGIAKCKRQDVTCYRIIAAATA